MTKSSHTGQNLTGGLRHTKRFGCRVAWTDIGRDRGLERAGAPVRAAFDLLLGELREPAFDEIEPGTPGRREVQMEARPAGQPAVNHRRLVRAVVVENQVDVQGGRHGRVDGVEELTELAGAMPAMELPDDRPTLRIQGGEQRGGAVADVVMTAALDLARAHRQQRLRAIQRLDLALLIDTEHEGPV